MEEVDLSSHTYTTPASNSVSLGTPPDDDNGAPPPADLAAGGAPYSQNDLSYRTAEDDGENGGSPGTKMEEVSVSEDTILEPKAVLMVPNVRGAAGMAATAGNAKDANHETRPSRTSKVSLTIADNGFSSDATFGTAASTSLNKGRETYNATPPLSADCTFDDVTINPDMNMPVTSEQRCHDFAEENGAPEQTTTTAEVPSPYRSTAAKRQLTLGQVSGNTAADRPSGDGFGVHAISSNREARRRTLESRLVEPGKPIIPMEGGFPSSSSSEKGATNVPPINLAGLLQHQKADKRHSLQPLKFGMAQSARGVGGIRATVSGAGPKKS